MDVVIDKNSIVNDSFVLLKLAVSLLCSKIIGLKMSMQDVIEKRILNLYLQV